MTANTAAAQAVAAGLTSSYPSRPLRFIAGFVSGGVADLLARALALKLGAVSTALLHWRGARLE
jgi:tripartite-type tricarboxylate transporter receptor subunit TctC